MTEPMISTEPIGGPLDEAIDEPHAAVAKTRKPLGLTAWLSISWLAIVLFLSIFGGLLPLDGPNTEVTTPRLGPFQGGHLLGADSNGRDMLSRLIAGGRTSMEIGVLSVLLGLIIGGVLGLLAGYFRNWLGNVLASLFDVLLAIPQLVLALALVSVLKGDPNVSGGFKLPIVLDLVLALGLVSIPILARITRASTLTWAKRDFVTAARAQGAGHGRILFREVLPNVLPAMMSIALLGVSIAIVAEGGLAILGVSVEPPQATWGTLINSGRTDLATAPFLVFLPIGAIFLTAVALNLLGDVVLDRLSVRESAL